jgi:hypothetical protein
MKDEYFKNLQTTLKNLSEFLGEKEWLTGSEVNGR